MKLYCSQSFPLGRIIKVVVFIWGAFWENKKYLGKPSDEVKKNKSCFGKPSDELKKEKKYFGKPSDELKKSNKYFGKPSDELISQSAKSSLPRLCL